MAQGNPLVGRTIVKVQIAKDKMALRFVLDTGEEVIARCDADCCSRTWVEHMEIPSLPAEVRAYETIDMPQPKQADEEYGDVVVAYGALLVTSTGHLKIEYRNESNGYYGGWIVWDEAEHFYGGVHGQNRSDNEWVEVE
jgi:hypothetical protein